MIKQNMKNSFSLGLKVWLLAIFLVLLIGGVWFFKVQQQQRRQAIENHLIDIARLKASQIAAWRADGQADAAVLATNGQLIADVQRFFAAPLVSIASQVKQDLLPIRANYHFIDIVLLDAENKERLSLEPFSIGLHKEYTMALAAARESHKPIWTFFHVEAGYQSPHLSLVTPLFSKINRLEYIGSLLLINDPMLFLYPLVQSWPTPSKTAETLLVQRDGDDVLFLNELRFYHNSALKLRIPVSQGDLPAAMAVVGKEGIVEGRDYRGVKVVAAIFSVTNSPWFVVCKMDKSEAFAEWHWRSLAILGLIIAMILLVAGMGYGVQQRNRKAYYRFLYQSEAALRLLLQQQATILNAIGDAVIATDINRRIKFLNPVAEDLTGWKQDQAIGQSLGEVFQIISEDTRQPMESPVECVLKEGRIVGLANHALLRTKSRREIAIAASGAPIPGENGDINGVVLVFREQTEERLAQRLIQSRLTLIDYAMHHSLDEFLSRALDEAGSFVDSPIGFYHFVEADQKTLSLQQWSSRTLKEFCFTDAKGKHYNIEQAGVWADCVHQKKPVIHNDYASLPHKKGMPEGHAVVVRELVIPILRENKIVAILGVGNKPTDYAEKDVEMVSYFADVTWEIVRKKQAEFELRENEKLLQEIAANYPNSYLSIIEPDLTIGFTSGQEFKKQGLDPQNFIGLNLEQVFGEFTPKVSENYRKAFAGEETEFELFINNQYQLYRVLPLTDDNGQVKRILAVVENITERKQAEQALNKSLQLYRELVQNANSAIIRWKVDGTIVFFNEYAQTFFGYRNDDVIGKSVNIILPETESTGANLSSLVSEIVKTPERFVNNVNENICSDGRRVWMAWTNKPIYTDTGEVDEILAVGSDITALKKAEAQIRNDLEEKTILLSEIHHRVKNSLQVVASLLQLQSREISDPHILDLFYQSRNRIVMMAGVYEKLYQTKNFASIDFKDYLQDILKNIHQLSGLAQRVSLKLEVNNVVLGLNDATPLALILNELFTNSIKHAFSGDRKGKIEIKLFLSNDETYRLIYRDNGVGFPAHVDFNSAKTLGLYLIMNLAKQIEGATTFEQTEWATFTIEFKGYDYAKKKFASR